MSLRAQVARLERALSRNSGNSSMPPVRGRHPRPARLRASSGEPPGGEAGKKRKRGKQPGAPGAAMRWAERDDIRELVPAGRLRVRRSDLSAARDAGVARSFQPSWRSPSRPRGVVQHDLHRGVCGCGREHIAERPPGVPEPPVSIGPQLRALAVYLIV